MSKQPPAPTCYRKKDVRYTAIQIKGEWFDWPEVTPPDGIPCGPVIDPQNKSLMVKTPEGKILNNWPASAQAYAEAVARFDAGAYRDARAAEPAE